MLLRFRDLGLAIHIQCLFNAFRFVDALCRGIAIAASLRLTAIGEPIASNTSALAAIAAAVAGKMLWRRPPLQ